VAALQRRAEELAVSAAKPLYLETEFKAMLQRAKLPPAFPGEEFDFNQEN
jgi:hypothetical protein